MSALSVLFNTDFLVAAVRLTVPIALAAMGATISERAGIINIAMEGMMLIGAFFAAWLAWLTGNPWLGLVGGVVAGAFISLFHAWATISLHLNHIVSGAVINILGFGITRYLMALIYKRQGTSEIVHHTLASYRWSIPGLSKIPVLGPVFFNHTPIVYITFVLIFYFTWLMSKSRTGLHIKAAGEHPIALETLGISVVKIRYKAVIISGMVCGLAGAYLSIENSNSFSEGMTSGRGFIALGANIAGGWTATGSAIASFFFGLVDAFALRIQVHQIINVPSEIFLVFPYIAAVIAVAGLVRKSHPPKSLGNDFAIEQSDID